MKYVFLDTEFTGVHAYTTLISIGMVTLDNQEWYATLNDYDRKQITPWVRKHVLNRIDEKQSMTKKQACLGIKSFLGKYSQGKKICFVSAGKLIDILLVFELWKEIHRKKELFTMKHIPPYLNHGSHIDLNTLFLLAGIDPDLDRNKFIMQKSERHNALHDARVVRKCFLKLLYDNEFDAGHLSFNTVSE